MKLLPAAAPGRYSDRAQSIVTEEARHNTECRRLVAVTRSNAGTNGSSEGAPEFKGPIDGHRGHRKRVLGPLECLSGEFV